MSHPALTVTQLAKEMAVSDDTVRKWINKQRAAGLQAPRVETATDI